MRHALVTLGDCLILQELRSENKLIWGGCVAGSLHVVATWR